MIIKATSASAALVAERAREALSIALTTSASKWPDIDTWKSVLPGWLVDASPPEMTAEEAAAWQERWRSLAPEDQARLSEEQPWALADWLYWLQPEHREWYWWDAELRDPRTLVVAVAVRGWPAPLGALMWLLRASGAETTAVESP